jgi:murein DD-endopeptidase MepM/ murein hydrolase activator NlpD
VHSALVYTGAMKFVWPCVVLLAMFVGACESRNAPPAPIVVGSEAGFPAVEGASHMRTRHAAAPHPDKITLDRNQTVYDVARRYEVPVRSIIEANDLAPPYRLGVGMVLVLPQAREHVVAAGDTLNGIAALYGVDASSLARANDLEAPYAIRVGQALVLPAQAERASSSRPSYAVASVAPSRPRSGAEAAGQAELETTSESPEQSPRDRVSALPPPPPLPPPSVRADASAPTSPAHSGNRAAHAIQPAAASISPPPLPQSSANASSGSGFLWPVHGRVVSAFGTADNGTHNDGINIAAPSGTSVLAAEAGVVAYAGNELRGYGNLVLLKHAGGYLTAYAHNSKLLVHKGESVSRGQPIARLGATGAVGEPQLHFEIRSGRNAVDPMSLLPGTKAASAAH